jgi:hypothetical protein
LPSGSDSGSADDERQLYFALIPPFNACHARKYFRLRKGLVANTLVAGNMPVNAQIIGAHDSHYVLDLLLNNTTAVQPAIHSTDTHGSNEVNFALLHVFGYSSPRATAASRRRSARVCGTSSTPSSTPGCCCGQPGGGAAGAGDLAGVAQLTQVSPVAWQHINF